MSRLLNWTLGVMQLIIFLYLLDNETSTVVLFSAGAGTAIEFWKVTKAMKVSIDWSRGIPLPKFEDKAGELALCTHRKLPVSCRSHADIPNSGIQNGRN